MGGELGVVLVFVVAVGSAATSELRKHDCHAGFSQLGLAVAHTATAAGSSVGTSIIKGGSSLMKKRESCDTYERVVTTEYSSADLIALPGSRLVGVFELARDHESRFCRGKGS
jgi:hypothetical protein